MSEFQSTFSIENNTGDAITYVVGQHRTSKGYTVVTSQKLAEDASTGKESINIYSDHHDYWSVSFINGSGELMTGNKRCAVKTEDKGKNVLLVLDSSTFTVHTPVSSPCTDVDYYQT